MEQRNCNHLLKYGATVPGVFCSWSPGLCHPGGQLSGTGDQWVPKKQPLIFSFTFPHLSSLVYPSPSFAVVAEIGATCGDGGWLLKVRLNIKETKEEDGALLS